MTWLLEQAEGATALERALGLRPELRDLFARYYSRAGVDGLVDPVVLELCRLRIAQIHGAAGQAAERHQSALDAGLTEAKIAELPRYYASDLYSATERACVAYAEKFVIDVHSITDEDAQEVKRHFSDAEFVAFTVALGLLDGLGRLRLVLGLDAGVSDADDHPVVPVSDPSGPLH